MTRTIATAADPGHAAAMRTTAFFLLLGTLTGLACEPEQSLDDVIETYCRRCDQYPSTAEEDACIRERKDFFADYYAASKACGDNTRTWMECMNDQPCADFMTSAALQTCGDLQIKAAMSCGDLE